MKPRVTISTACFLQMVEELDRVYPREGILVPLMALELRDPELNPCALIRLQDIAELTVARLVRIPENAQVNSTARVQVLPHTDDIVNRVVLAMVKRSPRLRACGYLHSHPFAQGSTAPSRGARCDYEGHMIPLLQQNQASSLGTSFSFIACRADRGWRLQCFGLDDKREIVDLGFAETVTEESRALQRALQGASWRDARYRSWLRRLRKRLRRRGVVRCDELFGGWQRTICQLRSIALVLVVPCDFPRQRARVFVVDRQRTQEVPLSLPLQLMDWLSAFDRIVEEFS